jgi:predicted AAA+ superfamily ATPase
VSQKISKQRVISLIRAISRNISTSSSMENIAKESQISPNTLRVYLDQLMRVYLLDELEAWSPHIRAKSRLRVKPKWAFCDPSIATASLGITSNHLINDREAFGLFFESLVLRDIRVLASSVDGAVYYISDSRNDRGNEIDIIVEMWDGRWAAFEVKLGSPSGIKDAVRNFEWLDNIISDTKREKLMSKNIIIAGGTSYTREDGINVISLAHLFA